MAKSIRMRLLGWYAAVLVGVVGGYAGLLYYEVRNARYGEVDPQLIAAAASLDATMRLFPPREFSENWSRPLPKGVSAPPLTRAQLYSELTLPSSEMSFAIWRSDGSMMKSAGFSTDSPMPGDAKAKAVIVTKGQSRELTILGPHQTTIVVGRSTDRLRSEMFRYAWQTAFAAIVVLSLGLAGGWVLSRRILSPIAAISASASKIGAKNLTERIDAEGVDVELQGLANVLNETFQRLQEAFDRQAQFTADASHELRTPLAILRSHAELALSRQRPPEEYRKALESSLRAADRMTELVERLLALARADAGFPGMVKEPVALGELIADTVANFEQLAATRQLTLTAEVVPTTVIGDPSALSQVFANLIANAIQYNRPGGAVRVSLVPGPNEVTFTVSDTGFGIKPADVAHLFERFYRVEKSRNRTAGGSGLGLAICKSIVEAHGGEIGVSSTPDEGSTFWVKLKIQ
jgi:heavy metal sensor kinase